MKKEVVLKIEGMDCIGCSKTIKETLTRKMNQEIDFLDIDFSSQKMFIKLKETVPLKKTTEKIINEIKNLGYGAKIENNLTKEEKISIWKLVNLVFAIISASLIFVISMIFKDLMHHNSVVKTIVLILATLVQFISGFKFYKNTFYGLKNKTLNMDSLIAISTTTAYLYSLYVYFKGFGHLYFETSSLIIAVVLLGNYIEENYKKRGQFSILNLLLYKPQQVNIYTQENIITIDVDQIKEGHIMEISKGQSIPVDSKIIEGQGIFDLNLIFGETEPVKLKAGDIINAGSILIDGTVKIQALSDYKNSFWKAMENTIYNFNTKRSNYQKFIDKISGNFVIIVIIFATLSFIFWYTTGNPSLALNSFISTLIIACPCAIGLASPLAINKGMLESARKQIIVKDPYVFEKIAKSKIFVFDKTGTITNKNVLIKQLKILHKEEIGITYEELILSAVSRSKHPLSISIKEYLTSSHKLSTYKSIKKYPLEDFKELTSLGLIAKSKNLTLYLGNTTLIEENCTFLKIDKQFENFDNYVLITENQRVLFLAGIDYLEELNPYIEEIIKNLKDKKAKIYVLTGAKKESAIKLANRIDIDINQIIYSVNAVDKVKVIENLKKEGIVVFIGDGLNDSLVMNSADVGISFEYGSDITQNSASVILKNISQLKQLIEISQQVFSKLKFNLAWVFGYNVLFIPVAMGFFVKIGITVNPVLAAILMVLSDFSLLAFNLNNLYFAKNK